MVDRKSMHAALKKIIVPELRRCGFKGAYPHFRRVLAAQTDLLWFQFDDYGNNFVIEISQAIGSKVYTDKWGARLHMDKLKTYDVTEARFRVQPRTGKDTENWFSYAEADYENVAFSLMQHLERAEEWWANPTNCEGLETLTSL